MLVELVRFKRPVDPPLLVALVGADCAGKSTLIRELQKLGRTCVYRGGPTKNVFEGLGKALACLQSLPTDEAPYYLCEHFNVIDSVVYAPLFGYTPLPEEMRAVRAFERRWRNKLILAYCTAPVEVLERRLRERGDLYVTEKDLRVILDRYQERLKKTVLNIISVETHEEPPRECARALDDLLEELISTCSSRS